MKPMGAPCAWTASAILRSGGAGVAVDQRGAVEQQAGREGAQHEIFEARLGRAQLVAAEGGEHVERQALEFEAEVKRDEVVGRDRQHHAGRREQDQHRILEPGQPLALI